MWILCWFLGWGNTNWLELFLQWNLSIPGHCIIWSPVKTGHWPKCVICIQSDLCNVASCLIRSGNFGPKVTGINRFYCIKFLPSTYTFFTLAILNMATPFLQPGCFLWAFIKPFTYSKFQLWLPAKVLDFGHSYMNRCCSVFSKTGCDHWANKKLRASQVFRNHFLLQSTLNVLVHWQRLAQCFKHTPSTCLRNSIPNFQSR